MGAGAGRAAGFSTLRAGAGAATGRAATGTARAGSRRRSLGARGDVARRGASPVCTWPRTSAPGAIAMRGARRSPTTRAPASRCTASSAGDRPSRRRARRCVRAAMLGATMPLDSTITSPEAVTSPSMWPCDLEIAAAGDAAADERAAADDGALRRLPCPSHVHVDVALELGAVGDRDARGLHVADDLRAVLEIDAIGRDDVAGDGARDGDGAAEDVGLDDAAVLDGDGVLRRRACRGGCPGR